MARIGLGIPKDFAWPPGMGRYFVLRDLKYGPVSAGVLHASDLCGRYNGCMRITDSEAYTRGPEDLLCRYELTSF